MRVLLVEDDDKLSEQILGLLQGAGLDVTRAFSQEDLLEKQQGSENFDLLVLDRLLGRYDTREALPQIRALWPKAGILFLSAINTPSERAELIDLGVALEQWLCDRHLCEQTANSPHVNFKRVLFFTQ